MIYTTAKVYPVSLEEVKNHLNIIGNVDDAEINVLIPGAVDYAQGIVGRNLISTSVEAVYGVDETEKPLPDISYSEMGVCFAIVPVVEEETTDNSESEETEETEENTDVPEYEEVPIDWSLSEDGKYLIVGALPEGTESIVFRYRHSEPCSETLKLSILMAVAFFYENRGDERSSKSEPFAAKYLALQERHSVL